jgi:hypothetical protein
MKWMIDAGAAGVHLKTNPAKRGATALVCPSPEGRRKR